MLLHCHHVGVGFFSSVCAEKLLGVGHEVGHARLFQIDYMDPGWPIDLDLVQPSEARLEI